MEPGRDGSVPAVETAGSADSSAVVWPQPIRDGRWTDDDGIDWRRRGGRATGLSGPVLRRLLRRPGLRVLHVYGLDPVEVEGVDRDVLLERVDRFLAGQAPPHSWFRLAEFRDDSRRATLVIEESC